MLKANAKLFDARLVTEPNYLFRRDWYRLRLDGMLDRRFPDRHRTHAKLVIRIFQNLSCASGEARTANHRPNDNLRIEKKSHNAVPSNIAATCPSKPSNSCSKFSGRRISFFIKPTRIEPLILSPPERIRFTTSSIGMTITRQVHALNSRGTSTDTLFLLGRTVLSITGISYQPSCRLSSIASTHIISFSPSAVHQNIHQTIRHSRLSIKKARHFCRASFYHSKSALHLGELLEKRVVLLEALFGLLEHRHRVGLRYATAIFASLQSLLAHLLDQLLEMRRRAPARREGRVATAKPPARARAVLAPL